MPTSRLREVRVDTPLGELHVRLHGEGTPVVMWPAVFVDSTTWDRVLPLLQAEADATPRRFVLVDPPGHGRSDPLRRTTDIEGAANAAAVLIDTIAPDQPVDWVGNAFGGHVGFALAQDPGRLRSLIAISSPVDPISPGQRCASEILSGLLRATGPVGPAQSAILSILLTETSRANGSIRRVVTDAVHRPSRASISRAVRSFILNRRDVSDELGRIVVPSLHIASDERKDWGPQDASRAAELCPGGRAVTIQGARTLIPLERPRELADAVKEFWEAL